MKLIKHAVVLTSPTACSWLSLYVVAHVLYAQYAQRSELFALYPFVNHSDSNFWLVVRYCK